VVESPRAKHPGPDFVTQQAQQVACGWQFALDAAIPAPFGRAQALEGRACGQRLQRRSPQQGVSGYGDGGQVLVGFGGAHLGLAGADEGLFLAEVHLDAPAPQVVLEEFSERKLRIGANQIGRLAIKHPRALAEAVTERRDDHHAQRQVRTF